MKVNSKFGDWRQAYNEGLQALHSGDLQMAKVKFGQAIEARPGRWEPYYARAWATLEEVNRREYTGEDVTSEVEPDLHQALDLGGNSCPDAAGLLGHIYVRRNRESEALPLLLQAIGNTSRIEIVERDLIEVLVRMLAELEDNKDAKSSVSETEKLEDKLRAASLPESIRKGLLAEVLSTRAFCHQKTGEHSKAADVLRRLAQLVPDHPRVPDELRGSQASSSQPAEKVVNEPTFEDVGGHNIDQTFQKNVCQLFETYFAEADIESIRQELKAYGQVPTRLILLFGPSGCGKTYMIRSFIGEYWKRFNRRLAIHYLRLNEIMDKWVGESEKIMTRIFEDAMQSQPSIIFADEVDSIGMTRDRGQDWRVQQTAHLLQELDRLQSMEAFVLFFGCTNRIWSVDLALMRRFDQVIPVEMPNEEVRVKIFDVHLGKLSPHLRSEDLDTRELAKASHGLTAGDIEKVVRHGVDVLRADNVGAEDQRPLNEEDLMRSLRQYRQPMHVREWVRLSIQALRNAGHPEMADDVQQTYGPYVGDLDLFSDSDQAWRPVPEEAWSESHEYDLTIVRGRRGA